MHHRLNYQNGSRSCDCAGLGGWKDDLGDAFSGISANAAAAAFGTPEAQAALAAVVQSSVIAASSAAKSEVVKLVLPAMAVAALATYFLVRR